MTQAQKIDDAKTAEPLVVRTEPADRVVCLTLNTPRTRNALSTQMMAALQNALDGLSDDADVAVVLLAAEGPVFCAGHDLKEMTKHREDSDGGLAFYKLAMTQCAQLMQSIVRCPKPVIAVVQGTATAAGCQLVASCDLAVAADTAHFATPGVNIGLFCSTPMVALARNVPRKRAMEMLLLGEMLPAKEAADYGLVNRTVPAGDELEAALSMARTIASKSTATVSIGKEAFYRQIEQPLGDAYDYAADVMVRNMMFQDADEGIRAFVDKRPPVWKGC